MAIPAGPSASAFVAAQFPAIAPTALRPRVLLMGLAGSLSPAHRVGDWVLYQDCAFDRSGLIYYCDRPFTAAIERRLPGISRVQGVSCDQVVTTAAAKHQRHHRYGATVVDMETAAVLAALAERRAVAVLRVISDDYDQDLPDLSAAIAPDGSLQAGPLALSFLRRPGAATRLVRGSLQGLRSLQRAVRMLCAQEASRREP